MFMLTRCPLVLAACLALCTCIGCGTRTFTQAYPGHSPDRVWTAMVAAAESPEYDRWVVTQNEVWVDAEVSRLEVYRVLERIRREPRQREMHERQEWELGAALIATDPPTARVTFRSFALPTDMQVEAARYFDTVAEFLAPNGEIEDVPDGIDRGPTDARP